MIQKIKVNEQLSQEEMLKRFYDYIEQHGQTYSKSQKIYARPGIVGEKIQTIVQSGLETEVVVKTNQIVIRNQTKAQEEYVVMEEKFKFRYVKNNDIVPDELAKKGYDCFTPTGKIKGIIAKTIFEDNVSDIQFIASWKELMKCSSEDIIAIPIGTKPEVYRIAWAEFLETYQE